MRARTRSILPATSSLLLVLGACGDSTGPETPRTWQLDLIAVEYEDEIGRDCRLVGHVDADLLPVEPGWEHTLPMYTNRRLLIDHRFEVAEVQETSYSVRMELVESFERDGTQLDSIEVVLEGPWSARLGGIRLPNGQAMGDFTCTEDFPLGDDAALLAAGYKPGPPISGQWTLWPVPLPD